METPAQDNWHGQLPVTLVASAPSHTLLREIFRNSTRSDCSLSNSAVIGHNGVTTQTSGEDG